mgnify:CR=1 FL=1
MIAIDEEQCLNLVKKSNLITGNYLDDMLSQKIKEVKSFMIFSGGAQKFSEYFFQRVYQFR